MFEVSSTDPVFSPQSGTSVTSDARTEVEATQEELFLILSEDIELRSLYEEAS